MEDKVLAKQRGEGGKGMSELIFDQIHKSFGDARIFGDIDSGQTEFLSLLSTKARLERSLLLEFYCLFKAYEKDLVEELIQLGEGDKDIKKLSDWAHKKGLLK